MVTEIESGGLGMLGPHIHVALDGELAVEATAPVDVPVAGELERLRVLASARSAEFESLALEAGALDVEVAQVADAALLFSRRDAAKYLSDVMSARAEEYARRLEEYEQARRDEYQGKLHRLRMMHEHLASSRKSLTHLRSVVAAPVGGSFANRNDALKEIPLVEATIAGHEREIAEYRAAHPEILEDFDRERAEEQAEMRRKLDEQIAAEAADRERRSRNIFGW